MSDKGDSPLLIFKFSSQEEMKKFFEIWKENDLGELVKSSKSGDMSYSNGKKKPAEDRKNTRWSKWGMQNLDDKDKEKPSLI